MAAPAVTIHPTAIVHPGSELGTGVEIGPFSIIEQHVRIGDHTKIGARVTIEGHTTIGRHNEIFTGAVLGSVTQDKKFKGGTSYLKIGDNNRIREYVTMNPATAEGAETVVGNGNLIMAYAHIAHDCVVKDRAVLANAATLAGHVTVEDGAILGGLSGVHQFIRIGRLAIVGGCSKVTQDVAPFTMVDGHPARVCGINKVGLERSEFSEEDRGLVKKCYRILYLEKNTLSGALEKIRSEFPAGFVRDSIVDFLSACEHGICRAR